MEYMQIGRSASKSHQSILPLLDTLLQSTVFISKSKGLSGILRDIRTSTYQICGIEENSKTNNHI